MLCHAKVYTQAARQLLSQSDMHAYAHSVIQLVNMAGSQEVIQAEKRTGRKTRKNTVSQLVSQLCMKVFSSRHSQAMGDRGKKATKHTDR